MVSLRYHLIIWTTTSIGLLFFPLGQAQGIDNSIDTEILTLIHRADSLYEIGQLDTSRVAAMLAMEKVRNTHTELDTLVAHTLFVLGKSYFGEPHHYRKGNYAICESLWNEALTIREQLLGPDHLKVAESLHYLGNLFLRQGKYIEAEAVLSRALEIRENTPKPNQIDIASTLHRLAAALWYQGKYNQAEALFNRALHINEEFLGPYHAEIGKNLEGLALLYQNQGRYAEAESLMIRALDVREKVFGEDHLEVGEMLSKLAIVYWLQGEKKEVVPVLEKAFDFWKKKWTEDLPLVALALNEIANIYTELDEFAKAESLYTRSLGIWDRTLGAEYDSEHGYIAWTISCLAELYWKQGRYAEAIPLYERALDIRESVLGPLHPRVAVSMKKLALSHASLGEIDKSFSYFTRYQRQRQDFIEYVFTYASENQKRRYIETYPIVNHFLLSFALTNKSEETKHAALDMVLKAKAVVIDAISAEKEIAFCTYDEEILRKVERHMQICEQIATATLAGAGEEDPDDYREHLRRLFSVKDSLETDLSYACSEFRDDLAQKRFSVTDITEALSPGSILCEFVRYKPYDFTKTDGYSERTAPPRFLGFMLDHDGNITFRDLADAAIIDSLVNNTRELIDQSRFLANTPFMIDSEQQLMKTTGRLYELLLAPFAEQLEDKSEIFIAPDGQLSLLPFEILLLPDGRYAIEKYNISYLSSGRDLLKYQKEQEPSDWVLLMGAPNFDLQPAEIPEQSGGSPSYAYSPPIESQPFRGDSFCLRDRFNPIPYTLEEIMALKAVLEDKTSREVTDLHGDEALEEVLKEIDIAPWILHLATHGFFCEDKDTTSTTIFENPLLRSGLALAGANQLFNKTDQDTMTTEDGILAAFEASGLNLVGTELVTLSACETGMGEIKNGEGVYGLRRAFQHAGARCIVMSLWKVPDQETCELMRSFYENWLGNGLSKSEALRQAALKILNAYRQKNDTAHPLFWGGFVMVGDPD